MGTPMKTTKTSTSQEQPSTSAAMIYPDWAVAFQAYYNSGTTPSPPPGYFHSTVASSPQPHPYMWGAQPLMPPYGTLPPPYAAMYPHGGMYAHPSLPPGAHTYGPYVMPSTGGATESTPAAMSAGTEAEGKSSEAKDQSPMKKSKESLGNLNILVGKGNETDKGIQASGNGDSQSGESGTEGSSEGSDDNSQNVSQVGQKMGFEQSSIEAAEAQIVDATSYKAHGGSAYTSEAQPESMTVGLAIAAVPISIAGKSSMVTGPKTNLNIGMDYWGGSSPAVTPNIRGKRPGVLKTAAIVPSASSLPLVVPRDGVPSELWLQDERELKRQRRKQSNRESARRSRLRKQAECEDLAQRVETLKAENGALRTELSLLGEECKKLSTENASLHKQLQKARGEETRDIRSEKNKQQAETVGQNEQSNDGTETSTLDSTQRDGRREEPLCNLDGRSRSLDNRSQAVSVSAG